MMLDHRKVRLAGILATLTTAACNVHIANVGGPAGPVVITGHVTNGGVPVAGATVMADGASSHSQADGLYVLRIESPLPRVALNVTADGLAPNVAIVSMRTGVYHYGRDIDLVAPMSMTVDPSTGGQMMLQSMGHSVTVHVPPGVMNATGPVRVDIAPFTLDNGPGSLEAVGTPGENQLQTIGMFRVDAFDMQGNPVDMVGGGGIEFVIDGDPPPIMEAQSMETWRLNDDGLWDAPSPSTSATGADLVAERAGFWNADRAYRTACVRGRAVAPTRSCGGTHVVAHGLDGIRSEDTAGDIGAFCVNGPQTMATTITFGSHPITATMPSNPGNCDTARDACADIGEVMVADTDCPFGCPMGMVDSPSGCTTMPTMTNPGCEIATCPSGESPGAFGGCCVSGGVACRHGGSYSSCADGCGNAWYEYMGRQYGPCAGGAGTSCIQNQAMAVVTACNG